MTSFADYLNRMCTVEPYVGEGAFGPVYGTPVDEPCRLEPINELARDSAGAEVLATSRLFLRPDAVIPPESRVTTPAGTVTTVIEVFTVDGRVTAHHIEAKLR